MEDSEKIKILIVSLSNFGGGASKIVSELFEGLQGIDIDVKLITYEGKPGFNITILNNTSFSKYTFRIKNFLIKILFKIFKTHKINYQSINIFPSELLNEINNSDASLVHLNWIGAEMISIKQIKKIRKKIIWTLHDAWALNGSCHINPNDYKVDYILSNTTDEKPISLLDRITLNRKIKYLSQKEITFTSPSYWLKEKYDVSFYDKEKTKCVVIPNFIDFNKWKPINKNIARVNLGIKSSKILLIFGANHLTNSYNKGFHFILELMNLLSPEKYGFIIFGKKDKEINYVDGFEIFQFDQISNEEILKTIYSAGDITIVPSLSESFSLISLESILCNTPVLAFNTSGIKDIVIHQQNGYLARKFEILNLLEGVLWLSKNSLLDIRSTILRFSKEVVIPQYVSLYNEVINIK